MTTGTLSKQEFLTRGECASYLSQKGYRITVDRLAHLACNNNAGGGPPFHRVRWNRVYYKRSEVEKWLDDHTEHVA